MINQQIVDCAREILGDHLRNTRLEKNLSYDHIMLHSGLPETRVKEMEAGYPYSMDEFLRLCHALEIYFFVSDKEGNHLNFDHMLKKSKNE